MRGPRGPHNPYDLGVWGNITEFIGGAPHGDIYDSGANMEEKV